MLQVTQYYREYRVPCDQRYGLPLREEKLTSERPTVSRVGRSRFFSTRVYILYPTASRGRERHDRFVTDIVRQSVSNPADDRSSGYADRCHC